MSPLKYEEPDIDVRIAKLNKLNILLKTKKLLYLPVNESSQNGLRLRLILVRRD